APEGAAIDPQTGVFTWTPTEDQTPAVYFITVRVTDETNLSAEQEVRITALDVNEPPVLEPVSNVSVPEQEEMTLQVNVADPNDPFDEHTFSLGEGAPAG